MAKVYVTNETDDKLQGIKEHSDENLNENVDVPKKRYLASRLEVWSLGLAVVFGGQFYGWNEGFVHGFGTYAIGQIMMGLAYVCLMFCIAEITSAIPFSGGAFGLARVCLGFYPGFIVGYVELFEYVVYSSSVVVFISQILGPYFGESRYCEWIFWVMYYGLSSIMVWREDRVFWMFIVFLALASLGLIIVYVLPSFAWVDFAQYAPLNVNFVADDPVATAAAPIDNQWFVGGMSGFMTILPLTTWAYAGIESMALATAVMKDAQKNLPITMVASMMTLFISSVVLLFVFGSQPPGLAQTASTEFPMNYGYGRIFGASEEVAIALTILPNFAMGFGFIPPSARLVASLGESRLLPKCFGLDDPKNEKYALIYVQLFGILFCLISFYSPEFSEYLNSIAILAGFITYSAMIIGFLMLRGRFNHIERSYRSPLGVPGAIFAAIFFTLSTIGTFAFQGDNGIVLGTNVAYILVLTIYYFLPGGPCVRQILSQQEATTLFRMNVINANLRKKRGKSYRLLKNKFVTLRRFSKILSSDFFRQQENSTSSNGRTDSSPANRIDRRGSGASSSFSKHFSIKIDPQKSIHNVAAASS